MDNEDGIVPVFTMKAVIMQAGLQDDDVMQARLKKLDTEWLRDAVYYARDNPGSFAQDYANLRQIIANAYQVAGAHDLPEHILDVLADPESATEEQIDAMLPYQPDSGRDAALETALTVFDMGLGFALCHRDFGDMRNAVKKLQQDFTAIRSALATQPIEKAAVQSLTDAEKNKL